MRTRFLAEKPGEILFTLKIEATAAEFEALRDDLARVTEFTPHAHPTHRLRTELNNILAQARKIFYPEGAGDGGV